MPKSRIGTRRLVYTSQVVIDASELEILRWKAAEWDTISEGHPTVDTVPEVEEAPVDVAEANVVLDMMEDA